MKMYNTQEKVVAAARPLWHDMFSAFAEKHDEVIALTGDLSRSTLTEVFRKKVPERYFNVGIAEQNMLGMAAGLALCGKVPYCMTFAPFATLRAGEQFRQDACYMNLKVRMLAPYGGLVHPAGPTHSGMEDAGLIRGIPNGAVVAPSDLGMIPKILEASLDWDGPLYIRLDSGANSPYLYAEDYKYEIGKALVPKTGKDAVIISFGMMLRAALEASEKLEAQGYSVGVVDMHTLKPLDTEAILKAAATGRVVTVEDHSIYNGLGSAVAETLMEAGVNCKFKRLGIPDIFASYGEALKLRQKYGYETDDIVAAVKNML